MKIALLAEKPVMGRAYVDALRNIYPTLNPGNITIGYHYPIMTHDAMDYPRGRKLSDYPLVSPIRWKSIHTSFNGFLQEKDARTVSRSVSEEKHPYYRLEKKVVDVDELIVVIDPSATGCLSGCYLFNTLKHVMRKDVRVRFVGLVEREGWLWTPEKFAYSLRNPLPESLVRQRATRRLNKLYFDYNYNLNSWAVMGLTATRALHRMLEIVPTKNELQLLYAMRSLAPMSDGALIDLMSRWQGSGRYPAGSIGSEQSRASILEDLISMGLAERLSGGRMIAISDDGRTFLSALHADCEDPDQIARLNEWCDLEPSEAEVKIGRYMRTFFGKQIRFMTNIGRTDR